MNDQSTNPEVFWALIDSNGGWGEPQICYKTIRPTEQAAIMAALQEPTVGAFSGYTPDPLPHGRLGSMEKLNKHGFQIKKIALTISQDG